MEFHKENLQILICNNENDNKLIKISIGRNIKFQNKTKKDEKKLFSNKNKIKNNGPIIRYGKYV